MPGILPMKVIKVGSSAQSRVAQACDRCRSKKIRCDGIRPCCTQCANVGFECKTSDKLSRRAFPRGYTESLEDRVRSLETEVRELKELLDEKDEKLDVLSRIHPHWTPPASQKSSMPPPQQPSQSSSTTSSQSSSISPPNQSSPPKSVSVQTQEPSFVTGDATSEPHVVGPSAGKSFIDAFKAKAQEKGKPCPTLHSKSFFNRDGFTRSTPTPASSSSTPSDKGPPPRLVSDQLVNVYFQEWAPLFPILHGPTFLETYEKYIAAPESVDDHAFLAQLYLIFGIASISSETNNQNDIASFEAIWQEKLKSVSSENSVSALQCLALAQMYCISKGEYSRLVSHRSLSTGMALYLGLQQSQRKLSMDALSIETRKRVFWSLYTLDCFSAALLGLPKMFKDADVQAEYPVDIDDENISKQGFHPSTPDGSTKISSALALFKASRILSSILERLYPFTAAHREVSPRDVRYLEDELEKWSSAIPAHLKLQFVQDKPSTKIISSRCPILSLTFYYVRSLVHRAVVTTAGNHQATSSILALAESSKRIIQIIQLLEERRLSFSVCLHRNEILVLAGFGLLYQTLELNDEGKVVKDSQNLLGSVAEILNRSGAPCASDFRRAASPVMLAPKMDSAKARSFSDGNIGGVPTPTIQNSHRPKHSRLHALAARLSRGGSKRAATPDDQAVRRATISNIQVPNATYSQPSDLNYARSGSARSESTGYYSQSSDSRSHSDPRSPMHSKSLINLDYLPLDTNSTNGMHQQQHQHQQLSASPALMRNESVSPEEWARILGNMDNGATNIYDTIYGGRPVSALVDMPPTAQSDHYGWSEPGMWGANAGVPPAPSAAALSFSEESLTSGADDFSSGELSTHQTTATPAPFRALALPDDLGSDTFGLDLLDGAIGTGQAMPNTNTG